MATSDDVIATLRESEAHFRQLVELSPEPIAVHADGRLVYVNLAGARLVGADSPEEMIGRSVLDFVHPDSRALVSARVQRLMARQGIGELVEERFLRLDGTSIDVETIALPITYQGQPAVQVLIRDVTARKQARAAQALAAEAVARIVRLQTITAQLSGATLPEQVGAIVTEQVAAALGGAGAMAAVRSTDGQWVEVVGSAGLPADQLAGYQRFPIEAPIPLAQTIHTGEALWPESPAQRAARFPHLADNYAASGGEAWLSLPLAIGDRVVGGLSVRFAQARHFDPDERAYALSLGALCAQALERALLYAETRRALQARDEFLSIAAHELKTPITTLQGTSEMGLRRLERAGALDPRIAERDYRTFRQQAQRLARLVEMLLDVSRLETGKLVLAHEPVDVARLVSETVTAAAARAPRHRFQYTAPPTLEAEVDPLRFEQVLTNLLENAVKFSPPDAHIEVGLLDHGDHFAVAVRDYGVGIPPEHRDRIFDRYHQAHTHTHQSGLGLGLYISRQIVAQHGGTIRAEFPADGGTAFAVTLPRRAEVPPR